LLGVGEVEVGAGGGKCDVTPTVFKRLEVDEFVEVSVKFFCDMVSLLEARSVVFLFKYSLLVLSFSRLLESRDRIRFNVVEEPDDEY